MLYNTMYIRLIYPKIENGTKVSIGNFKHASYQRFSVGDVLVYENPNKTLKNY